MRVLVRPSEEAEEFRVQSFCSQRCRRLQRSESERCVFFGEAVVRGGVIPAFGMAKSFRIEPGPCLDCRATGFPPGGGDTDDLRLERTPLFY